VNLPSRRCWLPRLVGLALAVALPLPAQTPPAAPAAAPASTDELFRLGQQLFDQLAPPEIKAQYEFPTREQWDAFALRLQATLEEGSLEELAAYSGEARTALTALRTFSGTEDIADWLEQRLDAIDAARQLTSPAPQPPSRAAPTRPGPGPRPVAGTGIPHYDMWRERVRGRALPARATSLMPGLRAAFIAEGMPPELAWLAEAESSFNPNARSPVGARGLFQFMPETARSLGLDTFLPDERTDPEKSAHAAARYLAQLHGRFGSWPLALAAYNAGQGRVSRLMTSRGAKDFAGIASSLPGETQMYVPKVYALIALRTGIAPEAIASPRRR